MIVRKIQIKQVRHPSEGAGSEFVDSAELQVEGNNLAGAWEAVGRKVVEVVAAQVEQLRRRGEASWDFGVTLRLTCDMLAFNLPQARVSY